MRPALHATQRHDEVIALAMKLYSGWYPDVGKALEQAYAGRDYAAAWRHAAEVEVAKHGCVRVLPAPPFMHGAAHWAAFNALHQGGAVVIQSAPETLVAADVWETMRRERRGLPAAVCPHGQA